MPMTPENIVRILFIAGYVVALICYFITETGNDHAKRVRNKMIMASMFLCYGLVEYFRLSPDPLNAHIIGIIALIFAWLGDFYLLYNFVKGGVMFIVSNLFYTAYMLYVLISGGVSIGKLWWCALIFLAANGWVWYMHLTKKIEFGSKKIFLLYIATTTFMGCTALGAAVYLPGTRWILFGAGVALYMISDYFLMFHNFKCKEKNWVLRANSGTYFIGMLLVALSYSFIV